MSRPRVAARARLRVPERLLGRAGMSLLVLGSLAGCTPDHHPRALTVSSLQLYVGAAPTPPPADDPGWVSVRLPDFWLLERRRRASEGWYRGTFRFGDHFGGAGNSGNAGEDPWAIFIPWLQSNAAVYVNGELVADDGAFVEPRRPRQTLPLLATVPRRLLRSGTNVVDLHLRVDPSSPGVLGGLYVGPASVLRGGYEWRSFLQETVPESIAAAALGLALLMLLVYRHHDPQRSVRWFAAGIGLWGVSIASAVARSPVISLRAWQWVGTAALAGVAYCFMAGFHRATEMDRHRVEHRVALLFLGLGAAAALVPDLYAFAVLIVWTTAIVALTVYILRLLASASRRRDVRSAWLLRAVAVIAIGIIVHDVASALVVRPLSGLWLTGYLASGAILYAGVSMVIDLRRALDESERLNRELERRVQEKHAELERNYETLRTLERDRAVADERERIMRDMHDGIGGQLVSTLSMVESGRGGSGAVADALRDALEDLRLVIDSLDPVEGDLAAALGMIRYRLEPRIERCGLRIDWRVADLPRIADLGPERVLQVLRIVQEAITNVMRHAGARNVVVSTGEESDAAGAAVFVEVRDDGAGFPEPNGTPGTGGRGLANMHRRTAQLGGRLVVTSGPVGTTVRLILPHRRAGSSGLRRTPDA